MFQFSVHSWREMEALTAVSIAVLTIYDMCKAIDREMVMPVKKVEENQEYLKGRCYNGKGYCSKYK